VGAVVVAVGAIVALMIPNRGRPAGIEVGQPALELSR
jgi:hypothetical protein